MSHKPLKPGEITASSPLSHDASLCFIGHVETPWKTLAECPKQGRHDGPDCAIVLSPPWDQALQGLDTLAYLEVYLWFHLARRDLLVIDPSHGSGHRGVFALRSPVRPNPIAVSTVALVRRDANRLIVRGLEAVDGTPLIDLKPGHCSHS